MPPGTMPTDRLLWEVQTLAANATTEQLLRLRDVLVAQLGDRRVVEIISEWKHELEEDE